MSAPFKSWMHLKFYKSLTLLKAKMLGKIWVVTDRHQDTHIDRRHPRSTVCWKSCAHPMQHTFQATTQKQKKTSGTLYGLLAAKFTLRATRTERFYGIDAGVYQLMWLWCALWIRTHNVSKALRTSFSMCEPMLLPIPPSHSCNTDCSKAFWEHRALTESYGNRRVIIS